MEQQAITTILFDLDGTLLPIDQQAFTDAYFRELGKKFASLGYDPKQAFDGIWAGTRAMMKNDGNATNHQRFWDDFCIRLGEQAQLLEPQMDQFYQREFDCIKTVMGDGGWVLPLLRELQQKGYCVALATNPIFPSVAVTTRLQWLGLSPDDFSLITSYENSRYCKPHLEYYGDILRQLKKEPFECLMVGNNPVDDMRASETGLSVFLLTDYLENETDVDCSEYLQGDHQALCDWLSSLPERR